MCGYDAWICGNHFVNMGNKPRDQNKQTKKKGTKSISERRKEEGGIKKGRTTKNEKYQLIMVSLSPCINQLITCHMILEAHLAESQ